MLADNDSPTAPDATLDTAVDAVGAAPARAPRRVLVIESDVDIADLIVSLLESEGYAVEVATDGTYGLLLLESFEPELILMGALLQRTSGMELTQTIRSAPQYSSRFRNTPIIYLTDNRQLIQQRFHALPDTPMSEYIFKPIDVKELLDKVRRAFVARDALAS